LVIAPFLFISLLVKTIESLNFNLSFIFLFLNYYLVPYRICAYNFYISQILKWQVPLSGVC